MKRYFLSLIFFLSCLLCSTLWARGGGGCLEQGTKVATPAGFEVIETLKVGDVVWSDVSGERKTAHVVAVTKVNPNYYLQIKTPVGTLHITDEHLVAIKQNIFRKAKMLKSGDVILYWNNDKKNWLTTSIISIEKILSKKPAFNLLVDQGATYLANNILVHNKGCFLPNTPILRADGTSIAIQKIKPGDLVQAYNTDGVIVKTPVRAIITHHVEDYFIVKTQNIILNVTGEHPFYIGNGTFKTVAALHSGDFIYSLQQGKLIQQSIDDITKIHRPTLVYNLQTNEPHTYFAAGIAVHNKGGGCFPAGTRIQTPQGTTAIELLAPGDLVITIDNYQHVKKKKVKSVYATRSKILEIKTDQGLLRTTDEHPLARTTGEFVLAKNILPGDALLFLKNNHPVSAIVKILKHVQAATVYNLEVESPHTYIADGFLVHNKGGYYGGGGGGSSQPCAPGDIMCKVSETLSPIFFMAFVFFNVIVCFFKEKNLDYVFPYHKFKLKAEKTKKLLIFLSRQDASVNPIVLQTRVRETFLKLQECWSARDYRPMQSLLMPDLYEQHCLQIESLIRNHEINKLDQLNIDRIDLVNARYTEKKEQREFTALITASVRDYYVDASTGAFIRGDEAPAQFQEFWTFQWQSSGWLLREIEQARDSSILSDENFVEQFTDLQIEKIYGGKVDALGSVGPWVEKPVQTKKMNAERMLNFLVQSDKLWDRQLMINVARRIFTDVHMALEARELNEKTRSELFPDVSDSMADRLSRWRSLEESVEYRNFCIRKVELLLIRNYEDKSKNEFLARISAHAQRIHRKKNIVLSDDGNIIPFEEYWTFGRLDDTWKLKEALPDANKKNGKFSENIDEGSSVDLIKWYYTKKRAI
jgi:predicted lipid-binding transport protein (Tim44 family)/intein/homing endonuclease